MPKVDTIFTRYGDFQIDYSSFNHLFFVGKHPECFNEKPEIKIRTHRDNGFKTFDEIKKHVKDVVEQFSVDYKFIRKVIAYKAGTDSYLYFDYFIANESGGVLYKEHKNGGYILEYMVLESSEKRFVGQRNIMGQITGDSEWKIIDYDEKIHQFMVDFVENLNNLKLRLKDFFDKDKVVLNIMETIENKQKLLS